MYDFETIYAGHRRTAYASEKWMAARAQGCPEDIVPLTVADMEFRTAPEIVEAVREAAEFGLWGYTGVDDSYRQAAAGWMRRRHGWAADPGWIVPTGGVVQAMYTAVRAFTAPGDGVILQPPVYPPFYGCVRDSGREVLENPLVRENGVYRMDFENLEQQARRASMMILCSPHNPVGRVWTPAELARVMDICQRNDLLLFSDEIHGDITLPPARLTPVGALPGADRLRLLVGTAASKSFSLAGLACSNIFVPDPALRGAFEARLRADGNGFNSFFGMVATRAAYTRGEGWLEEMLAVVRANDQWMRGFFAGQLPGLTAAPLEGTYLAWVDLRALGLPPEALDHFLWKKAQLFIHNGALFGPGGGGFGRVNLACPPKVLQEAMERLARAAKEAGLVAPG